ncbi:hypothetical protein F4777DRAFT_208717 [Nemania sp. FL0916]|nr:hypothetical protein F4777DRAFT_208717 [Nemania sp. FL0916]
MASENLNAPQLRALLDILIHHETYAEVQSFQSAEAIETYGWPFVSCDEDGRPAEPHRLSSSPLLQLLLTRLLLGAPAARDLSTEFWPLKFKGIMKQLGDADLSDSYNKGTLGTRKRLATAASVIHEAVTRGLLAGVSLESLPDLQCPYDRQKAEDLMRAWHNCISHIVYGDLIDEIFDQLRRTEDLEAHSPALGAAVEYAEIYIATFLHQVFILSSEGPYLLKLIENIHKLIPYSMVGQTLRLGNAATMISAMSKLFLSKVSVGAISNWIGLTSKAANGMNLMQRIVSLVLEWDATDFRKAVEKIKSNQNGLSKEHMAAIDKHLASDRNKCDLARKKSIEDQKSIIAVIFEAENQLLLESLTDHQHTLCLGYYAAQLAIRDREQITNVLCNSSPDLTTDIILECLKALDPMIRDVHKKVDLRKHLSAMESFLADFIKTTKPSTQQADPKSSTPTVKDFVKLLHRNRHLLWEYLHDFCGAYTLSVTWQDWMKEVIKAFRRKPSSETGADICDQLANSNGGDIGRRLQDAFNKLSDPQRTAVLERVNSHSEYMATLGELSATKMQHVIDELHGTSQPDTAHTLGPGIYALKWLDLLDETLITPVALEGPLRRGKDVRGLRPVRLQDDGGTSEEKVISGGEATGDSPTPPDVAIVIEALGPQFKSMVAEISRDGLPSVGQKGQ